MTLMTAFRRVGGGVDPLAELRNILLDGQMEMAYLAKGYGAAQVESGQYETWFRSHMVHGSAVYALDEAACTLEAYQWQGELDRLAALGYDPRFL